ncbi:MAG: hypothetical protein ACI4CS_08160, partial [Candidatus Weimeria sp.]
ETYYNLPMGNVVAVMNKKGYGFTYFIRQDGVKCVRDKNGNEYVLAAADNRVLPKGTIVDTSLGKAVIADSTGNNSRTDIDIAVNW